MAELSARDPSGIVRYAGIRGDRLKVDVRTPELVANEEGRGYIFDVPTVTPTGAGDYFGYLENKPSSGKIMHVYRVIAGATTTDETLVVDYALATDNSAASPTAAAPSGLSTAAASSGLYVLGEYDADLGLTEDTVIARVRLEASNGHLDYTRDFPEDIIIYPGYALRLAVVTGAIAVTAQVYFYLEDAS